MVKTCFKCGESKSIDLFYRHPAMADGYLGKCKDCTKKDSTERYYRDLDKIKAYEFKRNKSKHRRLKRLEYQRRRRAKYPWKSAANAAVLKAVRDGRLKKMPCEVCGSLDVEAHHDDYRKKLDVRWLCFKHHRMEHGQLRGCASKLK